MHYVRFFFILTLFLATGFAQARSALIVSFLDVGQGNATYIQAPNGNQMIIDGGRPDTLLSPLKKEMPFSDTSINILVVTNPDADHYGGFIELLETYTIGAIIEPGTHTSTKTYMAFKEKAREKGIPILLARKGMTITLDTDTVFTVFFPDRDVSLWERNDGSIVGVLSHGSKNILFMGDATKKTESIVMGDLLDVDILQVGHHGSKTSTGDVFVQTTKPEYAVISRGKDNRYGHPHGTVLETLQKWNAQVFDTALERTIRFSISLDTVYIH